MTIGTYVAKSVDSELSGNIIDLCPVGALTSKPYRFTARPWELRRLAGISPHDCVGSHIDIDVRGQKVMRVVARENDAINESWIADRDRFSYLGLSHPERLLKPMIKRDGQWEEVDWNSALEFAAGRLRSVVNQHGATQLGALAAYGATAEEHYLLQKVMRGLGSNNVDHRLRQIDFRRDTGISFAGAYATRTGNTRCRTTRRLQCAQGAAAHRPPPAQGIAQGRTVDGHQRARL
jgi:NADH-quinone oxidoreductase subunit G